MEKILVFEHVKHEHAKRFTDLANDLGIKFETIDFSEEYKMPNLEDYSRLIIMGGPQSAYEPTGKFPSKEFEIDAIREFTKLKKPVLGFCLGSQLIAAAFGGKVYQNIVKGKKFKESGFYKIWLTKSGENDKIFKNFPKEFDAFQWHGDVFDLPENSEFLATGNPVKIQAFKIKNSNTYGLLFHFDFLPSMVKELIKIDNKWLHTDNETNEEEMLRQAHKLEPQIKKLSSTLFKNWMGL